MRRKILRQKGFTLVEMLVAMCIFVTFVGILISSYTSIVRAQRDANEYRVLYAEARRVFDKLTEEIRGGAIYYPAHISTNVEYNNPMRELSLISGDGDRKVRFVYQEEDGKGNILFSEEEDMSSNIYSLTGDDLEDLYVTEFSVFVSPVGDPYREENIFADSLQFQPKVTVFAEFAKSRTGRTDPYVVDLQTTISSRLYTESPSADILLGTASPIDYTNSF